MPWLARNGLAIPLLVSEAAASRISRFAWLEAVVAAVALLGWIAADALRGRVRRGWLPALFTVTVGGSAGLPLHLYLRAGGDRVRGS